jgi:hypothetical protein
MRSIRSVHTENSTPVSRCTRSGSNTLGKRAKRPKSLKILLGFDLNKDVRCFSTFGPTNVDDHAGAIFATIRKKHPFGHKAVFCEVARMTFGRIRSPKHDHITAIGDLT